MQAWSPQYIRDITMLENVQRGATRMVGEVRGIGYEGKLCYLEFPKFVDRCLRVDMFLTYRLLSGEQGIDYTSFFTLSNDRYNLRGQYRKKSRKHRPHYILEEVSFLVG